MTSTMTAPPQIDDEDKLSALPDEVLASILDKLRSTRKTCGSSTRTSLSLLGTCKRLVRLQRLTLNGRGTVLVIHAPQSEQIELRSAPKLKQLTCNSWVSASAPLSLCSVPCLERLILVNSAVKSTNSFKLCELLANTGNMDYLYLNFKNEKIWIQPEGPKPLHAAFGKLTILSLDRIFAQCDFLWMMFLLKAAPSLQKFSIVVQKHFCCYGEDEVKDRRVMFLEKRSVSWKYSDFKHNHLEELEIAG